MSFENRFVVELFVKLAPFIDHQAVGNRVLADQPQHEESIPDLCAKVRGVRDVLRIEAKWIEQAQATNVVLTRKQIRSWQEPPTAANRTPHLWVARRSRGERLFVVSHKDMASVLEDGMRQIGPKEQDEDRYWKVALPGRELNEAEFWRDLWAFVASLTRE